MWLPFAADNPIVLSSGARAELLSTTLQKFSIVLLISTQHRAFGPASTLSQLGAFMHYNLRAAAQRLLHQVQRHQHPAPQQGRLELERFHGLHRARVSPRKMRGAARVELQQKPTCARNGRLLSASSSAARFVRALLDGCQKGSPLGAGASPRGQGRRGPLVKPRSQ